jgi:hypothetical protein
LKRLAFVPDKVDLHFFMILRSTAEPDSDAAERTDSFTWTFPGAPVRINIRFDLISRLQTELSQHKGSDKDASNVEIGGVLLGHKGRAPTTVEIHDCIRIPCEYQSDGLYTLNVSELERLRQVDSGLEERAVHGLSVVGYFRTQSKDVLRLRDAEIELVRKRFPDPSSVVLLIETSREQNEAGFFFWNRNTLIPFSLMNFPVDAALLRRWATRHLIEPSALASEEVEEAPPEPEIAAKRGHRDSLSLRTRLAAGAVVRTLAGLSTFLLRARWVPSRSLLATVGAVLMLTALGALLLPKHGRPTSKRSVAAQAGFPFQLSVQAEGDGVDVRWDPQSTPLADAHEGRLVITAPQKRPQVVTLDPDQLASGHIYYRSSASGLNFRLEIVDSSGKVDKESILALSSTPVGASPTAARQLRPAALTFTPPHASQVRTRPEHIVLKDPDPPQSVPIASANAPSVRLRASRNGVKSNRRPTVPNPVDPVVTTAVPAVPSVDQISIGAERQDITEKFGVPALSAETMVRGHVIETMVYGTDRAHTLTVISLEDGKVFSTSSR